MVNLMTMIYTAVAGQWGRWVRTIIAARLIAPLIKPTGLALFSASAGPLMRQQLLDSAVQLGRQSGEHILEVGPRVMPIELCRLQQAHHHCGTLAGQFAADEQPVLSTKRNHRVILPMSGKRLRFSTAGTRCMGVA